MNTSIFIIENLYISEDTVMEPFQSTEKFIYFDQAATSFPKPACVSEAVVHYMTQVGCNINRGSYQGAYEAEEVIFETRELLTTLFGGSDPAHVIFTMNITYDMNMLLKGLLSSGDHVLVSSMEHNAVMRPLIQLEKQGVSFDRIPCYQDGLPELSALPRLLRPETKALVSLHASNVNGVVMPIRQLGRFSRENDLMFLLDTAQTAGFLPINLEEDGIDGLAFTGHKGLLGPGGTGGFLLSDRLKARLSPILSGGTGSFSHSEELPPILPDRFEPGTLNLPGLYGLHAALCWIRETGLAALRKKEEMLFGRLLDGLFASRGIQVIGHPEHTDHSYVPVVSIRIRGMDQAKAAAMLDETYGIVCRVGLHCAPAAHRTLGTYPEGTLRFSPGFFQEPEEITACIEALQKIQMYGGR